MSHSLTAITTYSTHATYRMGRRVFLTTLTNLILLAIYLMTHSCLGCEANQVGEWFWTRDRRHLTSYIMQKNRIMLQRLRDGDLCTRPLINKQLSYISAYVDAIEQWIKRRTNRGTNFVMLPRTQSACTNMKCKPPSWMGCIHFVMHGRVLLGSRHRKFHRCEVCHTLLALKEHPSLIGLLRFVMLARNACTCCFVGTEGASIVVSSTALRNASMNAKCLRDRKVRPYLVDGLGCHCSGALIVVEFIINHFPLLISSSLLIIKHAKPSFQN